MRAFIQVPDRSRVEPMSHVHIEVSTHILRVISLNITRS